MHVILPEGQVGDDGEAAVKSYNVAEPDNIKQYKIPTPEISHPKTRTSMDRKAQSKKSQRLPQEAAAKLIGVQM